MAPTLCFNNGFPAVAFNGSIRVVYVEDGVIRYLRDGVLTPFAQWAPSSPVRSVSLAACGDCIAATWATADTVWFAATDEKKGTWLEGYRVWKSPDGKAPEQPNLRITPASVEIVWHVDRTGSENGDLWRAFVHDDASWDIYAFGFGKYPSLAPEGAGGVCRAYDGNDWWVAEWASGQSDQDAPVDVTPGMDPSTCGDILAYQNASAIYVTPNIRVAPIGLYPRVGGNTIAYELLEKKGGAKDDKRKRVGLAVTSDNGETWRNVSILDRFGLVRASVTPDGKTWVAVDVNTNAVVTGPVST